MNEIVAEDKTSILVAKANVNKVNLQDSPFKNPWNEEQGKQSHQFLTYESNVQSSENILWTYANFRLELSRTKVIKGRQVYDIITLIAEVSGFADLFMVCSKFLLSSLIQPQML